MSEPDLAARTLQVAEEVAAECERHGVACAVIGAMALAAHNYPRATEDFDLATDVDPFRRLEPIAKALRVRGYDVELVTPDEQDPLGGVLNVTGPDFHLVQVVNFENPYTTTVTPATAAIRNAVQNLGTSPLKVVSLPDLIALKLYAGGPKSRADVAELLMRNGPLDLSAIRAACAPAGLGEALEKLLVELGIR